MGRINYEERFAQIDQMIRQAQMSDAQAALRPLSPKKIPRVFAKSFADLARRVNLPLLAIKILNPIVRPRRPLLPKAQVSEIALYAALLAQIGARNEARNLLRDLDGSQNPEVYFYWLYVLIPEWDYQAAVIPMKKYIRSNQITEYQRLVGRINLAACYVYLADFRQAQRTLNTVLKQSSKMKAQLIYGNALELQAQLALSQNNFSLAEESLKKYIEATPNSSGIYRLYADKWYALMKLKMDGLTDSTKERLRSVQKQARYIESYETLRDLDYQMALMNKESSSKNLVYFGTPHRSYLKRIRAHLFKDTAIPKHFQFDLFRRTEVTSPPDFFLQSGRLMEGRIPLKAGQILHRCLEALLEDLYQPTSLGQLFSDLFPNEFFNPMTSPRRVLQTVHRLNLWFKANQLPLQVQSKNFQFSLHAKANFIIHFGRKPLRKTFILDDVVSARLKLATIAFADRGFTTLQLSVLLGLKPRQTQYLIRTWQNQKRILILGNGRGRIYRLISNQSQKLGRKTG